MQQNHTMKTNRSLRRDNKSVLVPSTLALAISSAMLANIAIAADEQSIELDKLKVEESVTPDTNPYAVPGAPYLAERVSDPRRTRPLAETLQTITVLTSTQLEESGRSDLREILDAQPGITLGTGENGNAFGDRYIIRGHEARSDVFVDGLRDPGMTTRESFATEQVEISKGPSSTFAGRGTTGGAVNSATKRASTEYDFSTVSAAIGTDNHHRLTLDTNKVLSYDTAIRANILHAAEDVPDRAPADRERKGAAFSINHQPTDQLEITADYYHFQGEDSPDLGSYINRDTGEVATGVPSYVQDEDFLESQVDTLTLRLGYELSPQTRIVNLTRYGTTDNGYVTTSAGSTTADPNGTPYSTAALGTHNGWQDVEYFANQLNLLTNQQIAGLNHEMVFSAEYSDSSVRNGVYNLTATGATNCTTSGRRGISEGYCIFDANGNIVDDLNSLTQRDISRGDWDSLQEIKTLSLSAMDTVDLNDKWTAFAGLRYDYYDFVTTTNSDDDRDASTPRVQTEYANKEGYLNGHIGASYKLTDKGNVYASYSTATNLNGGESDLGTSCGYGGICVDDSDPTNLGDPERTQSWELGTKWRLNDDKLLATAAVFRTTKSDVFESASGDSYAIGGTLNTGKNRVEGIEFGLTGNLTEKLSAQAGVTFMNAEIVESVNADDVGGTLSNFADKSATLMLRYQATPAFAFGGSATYESARYAGQPDSAAGTLEVPEYTVFDAFTSYKIDRDMVVRLNIGNIFDEEYYLSAYRSGAMAYMGDRRNARLTLEYSF